MNINRLVRMHRAKLGYSQSDIANSFGVTKAMISLYETGARKWPMRYLVKLVKLLDIPVSDIEQAIIADHAMRSEEDLAKIIEKFQGAFYED
jgi:DNA-binding XRE family transcriptional regulator